MDDVKIITKQKRKKDGDYRKWFSGESWFLLCFANDKEKRMELNSILIFCKIISNGFHIRFRMYRWICFGIMSFRIRILIEIEGEKMKLIRLVFP